MPPPKPPSTLEFDPINTCDWAEHSELAPSFVRTRRRYGARARGVRYETKVRDHLARRFGQCYPSQWIRFTADGNPRIRWCQPDNILVDESRKRLTIVEVKYNHIDTAYWQLFHLYSPVVHRLFHGLGYGVVCVEVVHWFDPATRCSVRPSLCPRLDEAIEGAFNVHILNPQSLLAD